MIAPLLWTVLDLIRPFPSCSTSRTCNNYLLCYRNCFHRTMQQYYSSKATLQVVDRAVVLLGMIIIALAPTYPHKSSTAAKTSLVCFCQQAYSHVSQHPTQMVAQVSFCPFGPTPQSHPEEICLHQVDVTTLISQSDCSVVRRLVSKVARSSLSRKDYELAGRGRG